MAGVSTVHKKYEELSAQWSRCRDVIAGTDVVKSRKTKYLPLLDSHLTKPQKYLEYIMRALFYNATGRTVAGLAGGIFQKAPAVEVDGPAKEHVKDITLTGEPIDLFALKVTQEYLTTGRYGILVDMATEEAVEPRPYWVGYRAEDIINWRFKKMGGDQELCLVVLQEQEDVLKDDEFAFEPTKQFRVLRLSPEGIYTQQVYKKVASDPGATEEKFAPEPIITPTRRGAPLDFIPFALPWAINAPPLLDLVDVNLAHYRASADLKHGLHFTALPTPWVSGQTGDQSKPLQLGGGTAWSLDKDGKAGMLEFTGKGLAAIRNDINDMQRMMATLGARLLEEAPHYAETALSVSMRHSSDYATLRTLAQIVEQQITWALKVHTWWLGTEALVTKMTAFLELNKIFFDQQVTADELRALLLALQSNSISYKTFYARLSATGWMREGVTDDEELADIKSQPEMIGVTPTLAVPPPVDPNVKKTPAKPAGIGEKLKPPVKSAK